MATRREPTAAIVRRDHLLHYFCAEQIMAMPALHTRRWTSAEVRKLTADIPLLTPRFELVDGELLVTSSPGAPDVTAFVLDIEALFADVFREEPK